MVIKIISVGKLKEQYFKDAFLEYSKRLSAFCTFSSEETEPVRLPQSPGDAEIEKALKREAEAIRERIPAGSLVTALCVEGRRYTSEQLSGLITDAPLGGKNTLVFLIGSSHGLSEELKREADIRLSMSDMTFPHQLARIMLAEQIYRAFMIASGRKYHK